MKKQRQEYVKLSVQAQQMLLQDVYQRRHMEACGVLLGSIDEHGNWNVEQVLPLRNICESPVYFEFDSEELLMIDLAHPGQMIGVYHSHPTGFAEASGTDRQNMKRVNIEENIPWVWLIIRGPFANPLPPQYFLSQDTVLAYHHYPNDGLQKVKIATEIPPHLNSRDGGG